MSICIYGRIKRKCIDKDLLERTLAEFFSPKNEIIIQNDGKSVTYEGFCDKNSVTVTFISEKKPPHNVYDSNITNDEFEYVQLILFDIKKEEATVDCYKGIINFCIYLKEKIDSDMLLTSDVHDDICLLKEKEIIWSKELSFDYSVYFKV